MRAASIVLILVLSISPAWPQSALALHNAVAQAAGCTINGASMGKISDRSTWRIDFGSDCTSAQRTAARSAMAAFDPATPDPPRSTADKSLSRLIAAMVAKGLITQAQADAMQAP